MKDDARLVSDRETMTISKTISNIMVHIGSWASFFFCFSFLLISFIESRSVIIEEANFLKDFFIPLVMLFFVLPVIVSYIKLFKNRLHDKNDNLRKNPIVLLIYFVPFIAFVIIIIGDILGIV